MRIDEAIAQVVSKGTKRWAAIKKLQERNRKAAERSQGRWERGYSGRIYATDIANEEIPAAYLKASGGGRYPANARQIMYAARPAIRPLI